MQTFVIDCGRPSIEYGSEVWEGNKSQASSLESIKLDGAKWILGCSFKTCNKVVRKKRHGHRHRKDR